MFKIPWFKQPKPLTEIDQLVLQLQKADLSYYHNVYSSDLSVLRIVTYTDNIIQYIKLIDSLIDSLGKDDLINRHQLPNEIKQKYLRNWFTDEQASFIDVEHYLTTFIEKSITLLNVFQEKEMAIDKSFNLEKNLLLTQHIINNIITICRSFLK